MQYTTQTNCKDNIDKIKIIIKNVDNPVIKDLFKWYNAIEFYCKGNTEMICFFEPTTNDLVGFYYVAKNKMSMKLYAICCNPAKQRCGIGKILWEHMVARAKELKYESIVFDSDKRFSGYQFFTKKLGLKPIEQKTEFEDKFKINLYNNSLWCYDEQI